MIEAAFWAALAASTLLLGALVARVSSPSPRVIAIIMALGSGVLIGSVAYELVLDAQDSAGVVVVLAALLVGALAFTLGIRIIERGGGRRRKHPAGHPSTAEASGPAIALGSVLDGIPESFVLGLTVVTGGVSVPLLAGIALSNFPEGMASASGLMRSGWTFSRVARMWGVVILTSAIAAALGAVLLDELPAVAGVVEAFAGGALLAMIVDSMVPEAYEQERDWTGLLVVVGFVVAVAAGAL